MPSVLFCPKNPFKIMSFSKQSKIEIIQKSLSTVTHTVTLYQSSTNLSSKEALEYKTLPTFYSSWQSSVMRLIMFC